MKYASSSGVSAAAIAAALNGTVSQIVLSALTRPVEPVVTSVGVNNAGVGYRYFVVAWGAGNAQTSPNMVNPYSGNSTLDGTHKNQITPVAVPGALLYEVWRSQGLGTRTVRIGTCGPGGNVLDDGTISSAGFAPTLPAADGGSAGEILSGPLFVSSPAYATGATQFGNAQFGSQRINPQLSTDPGPGVTGYNVIMTGLGINNAGSGINTLLMYDIGASSTIMSRVANGTLQNPTFIGGGGLVVGAQNYFTSKGFVTTAYSELGGFGGSDGASSNVGGRWQIGVSNGAANGNLSVGWPGWVLTGSAIDAQSSLPVGLNSVNSVRTNGTGDLWTLSGYAQVADTPAFYGASPSYEGAYAGFAGVSNVLTAQSWAATSGGQVTFTTTTPHGIAVDQWFRVAGSSPSGYTGVFRAIAGTTGSTLVAAQQSNPGASTVLGTASYPGPVFNIGPIAGSGGGTLRDMRLTGASVATDGPVNYMGLATGLVNVMACTPTVPVLAYKTGTLYVWQANITNTTTTPTVAFSGLAALTIVKRQATALAAGDYLANMMCIGIYDGTNMELLNPVVN